MIWAVLQTIFNRGFTLLVFIVLARFLSKEDFGAIAICMVFVQVGQVFIEGGFGNAIVQKKELRDEHLHSAFWFNVGFALLLCVSIYCSAPYVSEYYEIEDLELALRILSLSFIFQGLSVVHNAILVKKLMFLKLAKISVFCSFVSGLVAIFMANDGYGMFALIAQSVLTNVLTMLMYFKFSKWAPKLYFNWMFFKELFKFGKGVLGTSVLGVVNRRVDDFLISIFLGAVTLGVYSVAYRVYETLDSALNQSVNKVTFAALSKSNGSHFKIIDGSLNYFKFAIIIFSPFFILLALYAGWFIPFALGDNWNESVPIAQTLLILAAYQALTSPIRASILALGKSMLLFALQLIGTIYVVVGFFVVVKYGIMAVVVVLITRRMIFGPYLFYKFFKIFKGCFDGYSILKKYLYFYVFIVIFMVVFSFIAALSFYNMSVAFLLYLLFTVLFVYFFDNCFYRYCKGILLNIVSRGVS